MPLTHDNPIAVKKTILHPVLALAGCFAAFNGTSTLHAQTTNIWNFNFSGSIVQWTVPQTTMYSITAYGAAGGTGRRGIFGGLGAVVSGSFQLNAGEVLSLLAGGQGTGGSGYGAGGGGGSFVVLGANNTPLAVAGGGGGAGYNVNGDTEALSNATTNTTGNNAPLYEANKQGSGGTDGNGGTIGSDSDEDGGGGGGGFYTDGGTHLVTGLIDKGQVNVAGGSSYLSGGAGGSGGISGGAAGGFGGGGQAGLASFNDGGGGGGGGWSGGGGGAGNKNSWGGGGGGSYLAAFASNGMMSVGNTSNGLVTITQLIMDLLVGNNASNQSVSFTGETNIYPTLYQNILVGVNTGDSNNNLTVENAGTLLEALTNVVVGYGGSGNSMMVSNGGKVLTGVGTNSGSAIGGVIGYDTNSFGNSVLVTGSGSTWSNSGNLTVGYDGSGNSLVISNGGNLTNGQHSYGGVIGLNSGATNNSVLVTGNGSAWHNGGDLFVGESGAANSLVITNGGTLINGQVSYGGVIGLNTSASNNNVLVVGTGSSWSNRGNLTIGWNGANNSMAVMSGGQVVSSQGIVGDVSSNNSAVVTGSGSTWSNSGDLIIGASGLSNTMVISNGATVANGQVNYGGVIGLNAGANNNSALVTGNGSAWNNGGNLTVGYDGSGNSLVIEAGASVTTAGYNAPGGVPVGGILGYNAGSSGNSVLVTGSGSGWSISGASLTVGNGGSGNSLVVSNGGQVSAEYSNIGRNAGSSNNSVLVTGSSSMLSNTENVVIGNSGSGNSLVISDGGRVSSISAYIGANAGSSNNSVLVTGSGSSLSNRSFYGTIIGDAGEGTLTVANGGVAASTEPQGITVASQAGSVGTLNIGRFGTNDAAGTVSTPKIGFGAGTGTINFNQSNTVTLSTVISGNGSVNQLGSGTTTLTGNNISYTGTTTVSAGTLLANGSYALGTSTVTVTNTGVLGGNGTIGGATTIASGAMLAAGSGGVGSLTFTRGLTLEAGSTTMFRIEGTNNFTSINVVASTLNYGGQLVFNVDAYIPAAGDAFTVFDMIGGASETGNFSSVEVGGSDLSNLNGLWSGINDGVTYQFDDTSGKLTVQAIPEPSTYALLGLGVVALGACVLRRRRRV